jgi:hypothetical protein
LPKSLIKKRSDFKSVGLCMSDVSSTLQSLLEE